MNWRRLCTVLAPCKDSGAFQYLTVLTGVPTNIQVVVSSSSFRGNETRSDDSSPTSHYPTEWMLRWIAWTPKARWLDRRAILLVR